MSNAEVSSMETNCSLSIVCSKIIHCKDVAVNIMFTHDKQDYSCRLLYLSVGNLKKFEKKLKMDQFFVALNTISFLSFKQIFDAAIALDGRPIDFKVFQSVLGLFIFCLRLVS